MTASHTVSSPAAATQLIDSAKRFCDLPFVTRPTKGKKGKSTNWNVPTGKDFEYEDAYKVGQAYAAHLVKYLQQDEMLGGNLCSIVQDMNLSDPGGRAVCVGFLNFLERYIRRGADGVDPYDDLKELEAHYARLRVARNLENGVKAIL